MVGRLPVGRGFQLDRHACDAIGQFFTAEFLPQSCDDQREGQRSEPLRLASHQVHLLHLLQCADQSGVFQLSFQHLRSGLPEQQVLGVIAGEHIVEQTAAGLQLSGGAGLAGESLEHQPGDSGDFPELSFAHFRGVDALLQFIHECICAEQSLLQGPIELGFGGRQQFKPVVIDGHCECDGLQSRHPPGEECRESFVHQSSGEGVDESVEAFAGADLFDEQFSGSGDFGPASLQFEERSDSGEFGAVEDALSGLIQPQSDGVCKFRGQWHAASHPAGNSDLF